MSGNLNHAPAEIISQLLINLGLGVLPVAGTVVAWPIYYSFLPDEKGMDDAIAVFDTSPILDGKLHVISQTQQHYGLQVMIRSLLPDDGYLKANAILNAMDRIESLTIPVGTSTYFINAVNVITGILSLGRELPTTERRKYTLNLTTEITLIA